MTLLICDMYDIYFFNKHDFVIGIYKWLEFGYKIIFDDKFSSQTFPYGMTF